ncbi:5'-methylthioadenosine nucleosidase [Monoraphidium neglectum]|uniref:5'-methylthioadenosine nucleosidase n=1 Tax=Monoraphidium neglectum TaxID=145388 RepID=A0A0D2KDG4_9CHLO|nr:5'-methylthioadenosine nucleosidase [Monoraphidium neglectum]KIY93858.1 5'-methylthioadenosine nucleosidase [Monoraphidium neglectum]|eukprot:XP_013892878.1 5'-methylthioadenosine nucleosidase [Monoraphidium neglectum]
MEAEATPAVKRLGLQQDDPRIIPGPAPCVTFSGDYEGVAVHVVWTGRDAKHGVDLVGTVPASLATYLALQAWPDADLVISSGTAGGFKAQGAAIGDVFVSTGKLHHDRRIPLPGFDKYGIGFIESLPTPNLQAALGLKAGVVSTGDSLDYTDKDMAVMLDHSVAVKEMEAGSVAWAAQLFGKPLLCIKAVLPRVLEFLGGRGVQDL